VPQYCLQRDKKQRRNDDQREICERLIKKKKMMQIINNTGAIIKEQINLGNIDNLNIDDLFKDNTNNKKMKNKKYTFCKIFELEDRQILIEKNYNDEDDYKIKISTSDEEVLTSLSLGFLKEEEADKYFESITEEEVLRYFKNIGVIKN
jgi:hypothetical protein